MARPDAHVSLLSMTVAAAEAATAGAAYALPAGLKALAVQAKFVYGSGGTTAKYYLQTSLDGGVTWIDIACFAFATTTATKVSVLHLITALTAATAPTDGSLTDNTILNGLLGDRVRVKRVTTGTYGGTTTINVDVVAKA